MASTQRPTRRRSARNAFDEDDAPVVKRPKTDVNGTNRTSVRTNGATKKTTKAAAYDENDDGFAFSRTRSRKSKSNAPQAPELIQPEAKSATSRRKKTPIVESEPVENEQQPKRRRSARLSGESEQIVNPPAPKPLPKRTKKAAPAEKKLLNDQDDNVQMVGVAATPKANEIHVQKKRDSIATKIALPFADTPIIRRNKEMRKGSGHGHRRSSTGMRGRRASSLIDSGASNALPHSEVEVKDFYTLIEQSLPEPRRMRQLLTWCGERALPEKPSGDVKNVNAIMAARAIQEDLLKDFSSKSELSDWFSREDTDPTTIVKKPNPQNIYNAAKLQELEEELKRLEEEKAAWESLAKSKMPPPPIPPSNITDLSQIDTSLLDPSQAEILAALQQPSSTSKSTSSSTKHPFTFTTPSALQSHLNTLSTSLEPTIDLFADGVHKIDQYRQTAERVADRVLGNAAQKMEERDRRSKEKAGTEGLELDQVLRGLAGVLNER